MACIETSGPPRLSEYLETVRGLANSMPQTSCLLLRILVHYREVETTFVPKSTGDQYEQSLSLLLRMHNSENYKNLDKDLYGELVTACQSPDSTVDSIIKAAVEMVRIYRPSSAPWSAPKSARRSASQSTSLSVGSAVIAPKSIPLDTPVKTNAHISRCREDRNLGSHIFKEMEYHVYRGVDGFFEKHYSRSNWSQEVRNAYDAILKRHRNGKWKGFPKTAKEDLVRAWLTDLLSEVESESKNLMDANFHSNEIKDVKAQMDIFFRERDVDGARPGPFQYSHVLAVGKYKSPDKTGRFKALFLQLAKHVYYISRAQPMRLFVPAFTLTGTKMELWVFDPAGAYSSGRFDIQSEDGKQKFATALVALATMDHDAMGLNTKIQGENVEMVSVDNMPITVTLVEHIYSQRSIIGSGTCCWVAKITSHSQGQGSPPAKKARTAESQPYHVVKAAWRINKREPTELEMLRRLENSEGVVKVLGHVEMFKISDLRKGLKFYKKRHRFRASKQEKKDNFDPHERRFSERLRAANEQARQPEGPTPSPNRRRRSKGPAAQADSRTEAELEADCYDDRTLIYMVIAPMGTVLTRLTDPLDIMYAGRGAAVGLRCLFRNNTLHRDVSPANIILSVQREEREADSDPEGPWSQGGGTIEGLLIDLDVAQHVHQAPVGGFNVKAEESEVDSEKAPGNMDEERMEAWQFDLGSARRADRPSVSGALQRTGSRIYTAIGVLRGEAHTYRHDVESLFYSLLDMCSRLVWDTPEFQGSSEKPSHFWTAEWLGSTDETAANRKRKDLTHDGLEVVLENFPASFGPIKSLLSNLRTHIFGTGVPINLEERDGKREDPEEFFRNLLLTFDSAILTYRTHLNRLQEATGYGVQERAFSGYETRLAPI